MQSWALAVFGMFGPTLKIAGIRLHANPPTLHLILPTSFMQETSASGKPRAPVLTKQTIPSTIVRLFARFLSFLRYNRTRLQSAGIHTLEGFTEFLCNLALQRHRSVPDTIVSL